MPTTLLFRWTSAEDSGTFAIRCKMASKVPVRMTSSSSSIPSVFGLAGSSSSPTRHEQTHLRCSISRARQTSGSACSRDDRCMHPTSGPCAAPVSAHRADPGTTRTLCPPRSLVGSRSRVGHPVSPRCTRVPPPRSPTPEWTIDRPWRRRRSGHARRRSWFCRSTCAMASASPWQALEADCRLKYGSIEDRCCHVRFHPRPRYHQELRELDLGTALQIHGISQPIALTDLGSNISRSPGRFGMPEI